MALQGPAALPVIPQPGELGEPGRWYIVREPLSQPTATHGDWTKYPHLSSKDLWKRGMAPRAGEFGQYLERHSIWVDACGVCSKVGRGMRGDFGSHAAGPYHFKDLGRVGLPDGVPLEAARGKLWQGFCVPGGAIRFNHADGAIELWRGPPPRNLEEDGAPGAGLPTASFSAADLAAGGTGAQPPGVSSGQPMQLALCAPAPAEWHGVESCPKEGVWFPISDYIGEPTVTGGDATKCPFLASRAAWKATIATTVQRLAKLLHRYNVWPDCEICARPLGFEEHIPAAKHFDVLREKLPDGVPVVEAAFRFWQQWNVPGGAVRFNHVHGRVDLWRGVPPDPSNAGRASQPLALPHAASSQATVQPQLPDGPLLQQVAATRQVRTHGGPQTLEALPEEGIWFQVHAPVGIATQPGGDWRAYTHLNSRTMWKSSMSDPATFVCTFLAKLQPPIWPECKICDRSRGFQEHVPGPQHLKILWEKHLTDGIAVESVREQLWDQWRFRGGALRFNYADGAVELCRGLPPGGEASAQLPPQRPPAPAAAAATWAPPPPPGEPPAPQQPPAPGRDWSDRSFGMPQAEEKEDLEPSDRAAQWGHAVGRSLAAPQVPLRPAQPTPLPAAPAAPPGSADAATAGLCHWMWRQNYADVAAGVEQELQRAGIPTEHFGCQVCEGRSMLGGVAAHLLSPDHVRRVALAGNFAKLALSGVPDCLPSQRTGCTSTWRTDHCPRSWNLCDTVVTLHHVPPRVYWNSATRGRRERRPPDAQLQRPPLHAPAPVRPPPPAPTAAAAGTPADGVPALQWKKDLRDGRPYWVRSDGKWFWEDAHGWKRFDGGDVGTYFWEEETGDWFLESGRDMGKWRGS